jgi:hypothetical protein
VVERLLQTDHPLAADESRGTVLGSRSLPRAGARRRCPAEWSETEQYVYDSTPWVYWEELTSPILLLATLCLPVHSSGRLPEGEPRRETCPARAMRRR